MPCAPSAREARSEGSRPNPCRGLRRLSTPPARAAPSSDSGIRRNDRAALSAPCQSSGDFSPTPLVSFVLARRAARVVVAQFFPDSSWHVLVDPFSSCGQSAGPSLLCVLGVTPSLQQRALSLPALP
ncbi:hypothetical protein HPB50_000053 [Hyalomma asiaticum]|uniref:Uncharacterized protein n=1 Tax=Hyalomma asiaticum TaxID=266040 RepID=A0ACB7STU0_HYAAI|nr:hypothetical protein HPB50_000053 [Hyalomma asiaticum]